VSWYNNKNKHGPEININSIVRRLFMWKKILLGLLAFIVFVVVLAFWLTSGISEVANKQLDALRKGDVVTAYSYTSKAFQADTSIDRFKAFIDKYPALKNNRESSWSSREISNGNGTLVGTLTANDGTTLPVEYHFVKENNEWRMLNLVLPNVGAKSVTEQAGAPSSATAPAPAAGAVKVSAEELAKGEIFHILVSDVTGADGTKVEKAKPVITPQAKKILVSVYIVHAKAGLKVSAELVRIENGATIGPVVLPINEDGNVVRNFSFTNTEGIWPAGPYKINISTSNGQVGSVYFNIE
jgi:hypothetical protein